MEKKFVIDCYEKNVSCKTSYKMKFYYLIRKTVSPHKSKSGKIRGSKHILEKSGGDTEK